MATQREAWQAWPAGAPSHDPSTSASGAYAAYDQGPGRDEGAADRGTSDGGQPPGVRAARTPADGRGRLDLPRTAAGPLAGDTVGGAAARMLPPYLPYPGTDPTRPAAVRVAEVPRRSRRRAGTRRKVRPRDPLRGARVAWALLRVAMGLIFLWVFADRLAGLGRPVAASQAWLNGGSPTRGYLSAADGPFAELFHAMAGRPYADWLFMIGMAGVGVALLLGIGLRLAAGCGAALMALIYLAGLPVEGNPFLDQHIVYALVLIALALSHAGDTLGLGAWWSRTRLVRALPVLR